MNNICNLGNPLSTDLSCKYVHTIYNVKMRSQHFLVMTVYNVDMLKAITKPQKIASESSL